MVVSASGRSLGDALLGVVLGFGFALAAAGRLQPLLFRTKATDLTAYVAVAAVLLGVTLIALIPPAWRSIHVAPAAALNGAPISPQRRSGSSSLRAPR